MKNKKGSIIVTLSIFIIIVITAFVFGYLFRESSISDTTVSNIGQESVREQEKTLPLISETENNNSETIPSKSDENYIYYVFKKYDPQYSVQIKEFSPSSFKTNILMEYTNHDFSFLPLGTFGDQFLIKEHANLFTFDVKQKKLEVILSAEMEIKSAVLSHDKSLLAYSVYSDPKNNQDGIGAVWLRNINTGESKKIMSVPKLERGTTLYVMGWRANNKQLVVQEYFDGGARVKGNIYLLNIDSLNNFQTVNIADKKRYFLGGKLSPDGEKWLFHYCKNANEFLSFVASPCKEGEDLYIYSFEKMNRWKVYTSKSTDSNKDSGVVYSAIWQDSDNIIFATPDGIYKKDVSLSETKELLSFVDSYKKDFSVKENQVNLIFADQNNIIFERTFVKAGLASLNLDTGWVTDIEQANTDSYIMNVRKAN